MAPAAQALTLIEHDHVEIIAALTWCFEHGREQTGARLAGALTRFWHLRDHVNEAQCWLDMAVEHATVANPTRLRILGGAAGVAVRQSNFAKARPLLQERLALSQALEDAVAEVDTYLVLISSSTWSGDLEAAECDILRLLPALIQHGSDSQRAGALVRYGNIARFRGDFVAAERWTREGIKLAETSGDHDQAAAGRVLLAYDCVRDEKFADADALLRTVIKHGVDHAQTRLTPWAFEATAQTRYGGQRPGSRGDTLRRRR